MLTDQEIAQLAPLLARQRGWTRGGAARHARMIRSQYAELIEALEASKTAEPPAKQNSAESTPSHLVADPPKPAKPRPRKKKAAK